MDKCVNLMVEKQHSSTFIAQFLFTVYCEGEGYLQTKRENDCIFNNATYLCKNCINTSTHRVASHP